MENNKKEPVSSERAAINIKEIKGAEGIADEKTVRKKYEDLTKYLIEERITITTMESCTSGQVASLITDTVRQQ